jgi:hypothetical protein
LGENDRTALEQFGASIAGLRGEGFEKDWFLGNQFDDRSLAENLEEIERLITQLGDDLRS